MTDLSPHERKESTPLEVTPLSDVDLEAHHGARTIADYAEHLLFHRRIWVLAVFCVASIFLGWHASKIGLEASFQKMIPASHPYIENYLVYEDDLRKMGNVLRIVVENTGGDIYDKNFLLTLKKINDEVFYIPGVDRGNMKSLWTPNVFWREVTVDGIVGGLVVPDDFDGTPGHVDQIRRNVSRSGTVGSLVANDHRSTVILVPLLEKDPQTGESLDYGLLSERLEQLVRDKYAVEGVRIHITGFAKIMGDLIEGVRSMALFFAVTFVLTVGLLYFYSRCWRSTASVIFCCSLAVVWQLGIVRLMGYALDPYSTLVPFLTFAIGVSHAIQNINTMVAERLGGLSSVDASKATFRLLFVPGSVALLCNVVGFSTLLVIDIGVIRELAISACVGVLVIIFTKIFLLPVIMSYTGISERGLQHRALKVGEKNKSLVRRGTGDFLSRLTERRWALGVVLTGLAILAASLYMARDLRIGDLDPGAPELRADSRYNRDVAFLSANYANSADVFVVMVKTRPDTCGTYPVTSAVDRFQAVMGEVEGVVGIQSLVTEMKGLNAALQGGNLKWYGLSRDEYISSGTLKMTRQDFYKYDCSMLSILLFLEDHKADTLTRVVAAAEAFAAANNTEHAEFLLAAGNAGIEAVTNIVVKRAERLMLFLVYGVVALLVWWEFKSWKVTTALILPLLITSILCEAIMAKLGLGVKVATLPVIVLGVGIGVDYGIYLYNRLENYLRMGMSLKDAYGETLKTTGAAIAVTAVTLALGVATWLFSDIKFQADMGLLLAIMFLWNMVGAILIIPAVLSLLLPAAVREGSPVQRAGG
ncbi:putative exporter, RND superfamily protein [Azoarcus sp. CIB]|uniref:efflux RND transporter permease subunit n=1 Tax=Aromatoleum sp. (strain CIB) TaxID=198107 RepID=UPI0006A2CAC7|nr:MMPL family transporter [Azoarcus sp. CIB]AKU12415.1 putative exporter, RND superfamily protein [Azoarcus sp. CIB]